MKMFFKAMDFVEEAVVICLLVLMVTLNFANVVARYCLTASISFTEELTIMAFVWLSMMGIAVGYKRGCHLGMSFVVDHMPKRMQAWFALLSMALSVITITILFKFGADMVQQQISLGATTASLRLPATTQGLAIPVGCFFIIIRAIQLGITSFLRLRKEGKGGGEVC